MQLRPRHRLVRTVLPLALASSGLVVGVAGASWAIDGDDCRSIDSVETTAGSQVTDFAADGSPARVLDLEGAQRRVRSLTGREPGDGVTVAVLDSGVKAQPLLPSVVAGPPAPGATSTPGSALVWHQGTLLAGVIAASPDPATEQPVGIAPGATIYDQRIYEGGPDSDDELVHLGPDSVAQGLEAIAPSVGPDGISIVTIGVVDPEDSDRLREAVDLVTGRGAIIVAASAPRPGDDEPDSPGATFRDGEDYADFAWPAGYARDNPRVVAVTTTGASGDGQELDPAAYTLFSSAIDVAAPTGGLVSVGINEEVCSLPEPSTAVSAAVVAGVLALLESAFPDERPEQLIARLEATAAGATSGDPATPNTREGKGVVQPLEALTRPLAPSRDGTLPVGEAPEQQVEPAVLPVPPPDLLASTRENAVWWGLLGGGALVVLVLLRPVLSRRRGS